MNQVVFDMLLVAFVFIFHVNITFSIVLFLTIHLRFAVFSRSNF